MRLFIPPIRWNSDESTSFFPFDWKEYSDQNADLPGNPFFV
jgi:hypothetical protein